MRAGPETAGLPKYKLTVDNPGGYADGIQVQEAIQAALEEHAAIAPIVTTVGATTLSVVYKTNLPIEDAEEQVRDVIGDHISGTLDRWTSTVLDFGTEVVGQTAVDIGDTVTSAAEGAKEVLTGSTLKWVAVAVVVVVIGWFGLQAKVAVQ